MSNSLAGRKKGLLIAATALAFCLVIAIFLGQSADRNHPTRKASPTHRIGAPTHSAMINGDCAPWDGPAFAVSVVLNTTETLTISIWKSAHITSPIAFAIESEQTPTIGMASISSNASPNQEIVLMTGSVYFERVTGSAPVKGEFDFKSREGRNVKGTFKAAWSDEHVGCG